MMKKILVVTPEDTKNKHISRGFARGFEQNTCKVMMKNANEITEEFINKFMPDMIFSCNASFLQDKNCTELILNSGKSIVCYFTKDPKKTAEKLNFSKVKFFVNDKKYLNNLQNSFYLPLAANFNKYQADFSGFNHTITFAGEPLGQKRLSILCELIKTYKSKLNIFCDEKSFEKSLKEIKKKNLLDENDLKIYSNSRKGFVETEQELAKIYNSSKINLNIARKNEFSINYRVFEILASKGFLISDKNAEMEKRFESSKHLETFKDISDLKDKIDFYLKNLNIAQRIAQLGRQEAAKNNAFSARAKVILKKR